MFAEIYSTRAGGVVIKTPYLQDFVEELKLVIPRGYRQWDKEDKSWYVEPSYAEEATELFWQFFPDGDSYDLARVYHEPPDWARVLFVQEDAPMQVIEAAYRTLAKMYHPDAGGSEKKMIAINEAIEHAREAKNSYRRAAGE